MDTRTGDIIKGKALKEMLSDEEQAQYLEEMKRHPTPREQKRGKVGRNSACPCGTGKKFKRCCMWKLPLHKR